MVKVNNPEYKFEEKRFESFCNRYQFEFPKEFVDYLRKYNDAELELNVLDIGNNECCVRFFYGTGKESYTDIWRTYEVYEGRMPKKCIPIADVDFGNNLCMSLQEDTYGRIYFWDHETMDTDDGEVCEIGIEDMNEIAASFKELLDNIKEDSYEFEVEEKPNFFKNILKRIKNR